MINYVDNTEACGKVLDCRLLLAVGGRLTFFVWGLAKAETSGWVSVFGLWLCQVERPALGCPFVLTGIIHSAYSDYPPGQ